MRCLFIERVCECLTVNIIYFYNTRNSCYSVVSFTVIKKTQNVLFAFFIDHKESFIETSYAMTQRDMINLTFIYIW